MCGTYSLFECEAATRSDACILSAVCKLFLLTYLLSLLNSALNSELLQGASRQTLEHKDALLVVVCLACVYVIVYTPFKDGSGN